MFDFLKRTKEDVRIDLPGIQVAFNHRLRVCFLYTFDSSTTEATYQDLENYLARKKYFLVVIAAPPGLPMAMPQDFNDTTG